MTPNVPILAASDTDFIKIIFFLVIMGIVGISKLIKKIQENSQKSQPPAQSRPKESRPPTWQTKEDEVRKFLEQMERESEPTPVPPPVIPQRPHPVEEPAHTFQTHVDRDTGESSVGDEAGELLQTDRPATHVESSREVEYAADAFSQHISSASIAATPASARIAARAARASVPALTMADIRKDLRDRSSIQRAFILSEILSPPRGL